MREIVVNTFLSLDGVMQAPGGPGEDPEHGFAHEGWAFGYWDAQVDQAMTAFMGRKPFDLLIGRRTYEIFAAHWPHAGEEEGAGPLNRATKYVVSTTLARADWQPAVLIGRDVVAAIARLKGEDGPELQVHGSSRLLQTLIAHNLIDRFQIMTFPVLLGRGKRLFGDGTIPAGLRLIETTVAASGVIIATYEPAGPIALGSFAPDAAD